MVVNVSIFIDMWLVLLKRSLIVNYKEFFIKFFYIFLYENDILLF